MFAYGGKVFTKRISNRLKVQIEDAEKIKIDYSNGAVNETQSRTLREMLSKDCLVWAQGVESVSYTHLNLVPSFGLTLLCLSILCKVSKSAKHNFPMVVM